MIKAEVMILKEGFAFGRKSISFVTYCLLLLSVCSKVPQIPLLLHPLTLEIPKEEKPSLFGKVKQIRIDHQDNLYVLDSENFFIYKFGSDGKFLAKIGGEGPQLGMLSKPCSFDIYRDSLIIIYNLGVLDFLDINGKGIRSLYLSGRADISVSPGGQILINRMMDASQFGYFIEVWSLQGDTLSRFKPARGQIYKNSEIDIAFTGFTSDNRLVYVPSAIDSIFIYNLNGQIEKKAKRFSLNKRSKKQKKLSFEVEDICVHNDKIYLLFVNQQKSTKEKFYFRDILQYNLDLKLERIYKLPEPVTMTVATEPWAPWYHKFLVTDKYFLIMVSNPEDHLLAFRYNN